MTTAQRVGRFLWRAWLICVWLTPAFMTVVDASSGVDYEPQLTSLFFTTAFCVFGWVTGFRVTMGVLLLAIVLSAFGWPRAIVFAASLAGAGAIYFAGPPLLSWVRGFRSVR